MARDVGAGRGDVRAFRTSFLVVMLAMLSTVFMVAPAVAQTGPLEGRYEFTGKSTERYFEMSDSNGTFTGRTSYVDVPPPEIGQTITMAWSFRISPSVRSIATSPMTCTTDVAQVPSYRDYHPDIPVDYFLHSSVPMLGFNTNYDLEGKCVFQVNVGGRPGTATLTYKFHFRIADGLPYDA